MAGCRSSEHRPGYAGRARCDSYAPRALGALGGIFALLTQRVTFSDNRVGQKVAGLAMIGHLDENLYNVGIDVAGRCCFAVSC